MSIFSYLRYSIRKPEWESTPPTKYSIVFSLKGLTIGVDNVRHDVHLSPGFCAAAEKIILQLIAKHAHAEKILNIDVAGLPREAEEFKRLCRDVMRDAVNMARRKDVVQIDFLAQAAVIKLLTEKIHGRFEALIDKFNNCIWEQEFSHQHNTGAIVQLKEKLATLRQNRKAILRGASRDIFSYLIDAQHKGLQTLRAANFGNEAILADEVSANPMLMVEDPHDDFFMIEEYVLLGHRLEDPNKYDTLILIIKNILGGIVMKNRSAEPKERAAPILQPAGKKAFKRPREVADPAIAGWIKHPGNFDMLLNIFQTEEQCRLLKNQRGTRQKIKTLKKIGRAQKRLLDFFYWKFEQAGLIKSIVASYEIKQLYLEYHPSLAPQQILQFLTVHNVRRGILSHLKRLKKFYGKTFPIAPLRKKLRTLMFIKKARKKEYLLRFLKDFSRYHRDRENFYMLKKALDRINLTTEKHIVELSRANNSLYEFLLPHEHVLRLDESPVIHHVILKADIRGATNITGRLREKGLNPASYFSLNFFDPVAEMLREYNAEKVFIEGDAIILAIFERQNTRNEGYSVARACGLATNMLSIIQRYNAKNKKYQLPVLEIGIGICYQDTPPAYLFDNEKRIVISPAINLADRLSSSDKSVGRFISGGKRPPFNLYVFQTMPEDVVAATNDDVFLRYNVNGIEINKAGFEKLSAEINLQRVKYRGVESGDEEITLYSGKFPTMSGKFQRLVIREANIPQAAPEDLRIIRLTNRKYYEVCTHPRFYDYVR